MLLRQHDTYPRVLEVEVAAVGSQVEEAAVDTLQAKLVTRSTRRVAPHLLFIMNGASN